MIRLILILILIFSLLSGCAVYTFNPKGKSTISSVFIERFANETSEYGLEDKMTDLIIDAFIADGTIKVVSPENAEATISGTLTRYERKPYNPDINDEVDSYAVTMYFSVKLVNNIDGVEIWTERINQIGVYNLEIETEEDGQHKAIELLVEDIINKTAKNW